MTERRKSRPNWHPLVVVSGALFVIPLTITASGVLNPVLAVGFRADYARSQWVINAFMVSYSACMALSGAVADGLGRKGTFVVGLLLLVVFSLLAATSTSILGLTLARAGTGIGAAAVTTAGTAIVATEYAGPFSSRAFALFGTALGLGLALGPLTGALSVGLAGGWRPFYLGSSVLLLGLMFSAMRLPRDLPAGRREVDWLGGALFTLALVCLVSSLSILPMYGLSDRRVEALLASAGALCLIFGAYEAIQPHPAIDFSLLRNRQYGLLCMTVVFLGFGYISLLFYLPQFLIVSGGLSSLEVGATLTFATVPCLVIPPVIAAFRHRLSLRLLLLTTYLFLMVGPFALSLVVYRPGIITFAVPLLLAGTSFGVSLAFLDGAAVSSVETHRSGAAAGMFNTFRLGGEAIMIPTTGALIAAFFPHTSLPKSGIGSVIQGDLRQASSTLDLSRKVMGADFSHALRWTLLVIMLASCVGLFVVVRFTSRTPKASRV